MKPIEEKEPIEYFLKDLFLVTGFSFLLFTLILRILDGIIIKPLFLIGLATFGVGLIVGTSILLNNKTRKDKNKMAS